MKERNKKANASAMTDEQLGAVEDGRTRVCVVAGAGCGKTSVLVEHFLHLIEQGHSADSIVAITFTEKAAAEMTDRLRNACAKRAETARDDEAKQKWEQAFWAVQTGAASTIHGLAQRILKGFPFAAGLDPRFTILDGNESEMLLEAACSDTLRRLLESENAELGELLADYSLMAIREAAKKLLAHRDAFRQLRENADIPEDELFANIARSLRSWARRTARIKLTTPDMLEAFKALVNLKNAPAWTEETDILAHDVALTANLWPSVLREIEIKDPDKPISEFPTEDFVGAAANRGKKENWRSQEELKEARAAFKTVKKAFLETLNTVLREPGEAERAQLAKTRLFTGVAAGIQDYYERLKEIRATVDFDDLLEKSYALLTGDDEVREATHRRIKCVLVDELQDISPIQWSFIKALVSGGNDSHLFMVGDEKQSIYRFRGADVRVFRDVQSTMAANGLRHELTLSFRFHPKLNTFYNFLFEHLFEQRDEEPFRTLFNPLDSYRKDVPEDSAIEFMAAHMEDGQDSQAGRAEEARLITARIRQIITEREPKVFDQKTRGMREPKLADIAILLRATSDLYIYERAMREAGIDYYVSSSATFYETQVVNDIYYLVRTLANPRDAMALCAVLRGPFCSLNDNTLAVLSAGGSLPDAFADWESFKDKLEGAETQRLADAAEIITKLRDDYGREMISSLIESAIEMTGYDAYLLATFMGHQHLANGLKIIGEIRKLESDGFTASETLNRLKSIMTAPPRESEAVIADPDMDHVQIMTIHKSKGLEFPIVFIPDIGRQDPRKSDTQLYPEVGMRTPNQRIKDDKGRSLIDNYIKYYETEQATEESKRLLYVAATRARDHLVFSCFKSSGRQSTGAWQKWLDGLFPFLAAEHGDLIPYDDYSCRVIREITALTPYKTFHHLGDKLLEKIADDPDEQTDIPSSLSKRIEPVAPLAGKGTQFSVTEIAAYRKDPQSYKMKYIVGLKGESSHKLLRTHDDENNTERGTAFHKFFELLVKNVQIEEAARFASELTRLDAPEKEKLAREMAGAHKALVAKGLLEGVPAGDGDTAEMDFAVPVDSRILVGKFDLFRLAGDTARIIDYKTTRHGAKNAAKYTHQLELYALAAFKLNENIKTVETVIIFTESSTQYTKKYERSSLEKLEADALEAMLGIEELERRMALIDLQHRP